MQRAYIDSFWSIYLICLKIYWAQQCNHVNHANKQLVSKNRLIGSVIGRPSVCGGIEGGDSFIVVQKPGYVLVSGGTAAQWVNGGK